MTTPTDIERLKALTIAIQSYQQADEEGVMVLVSRQACDETAAALRALPSLLARIERVEGEPSAISLLERARDELVECAQDYHHQPKAMIAEINAYLAAAEQSLSSARAEIEGQRVQMTETLLRAQGSKCGCNGQDDMCVCQNVVLQTPDMRAVAIDPRDPDPTREGIFRNHNCSRCQNGAKPCVQGHPNRCEFPHARND